jgi:hypothetical protein
VPAEPRRRLKEASLAKVAANPRSHGGCRGAPGTRPPATVAAAAMAAPGLMPAVGAGGAAPAGARRAAGPRRQASVEGALASVGAAAAAAGPQRRRAAAAAKARPGLQLLAAQAPQLASHELAAAARSAGALLGEGWNAHTRAAAHRLLRALAGVARSQLPDLPARELAALAAAWPPGPEPTDTAGRSSEGAAAEGAAGPGSPSSSAAADTLGSSELVAALEAALRRRQPPGSWDAAGVADLARALRSHAAPPGSSALLSLAMLTVEVASRQREAAMGNGGPPHASAAAGLDAATAADAAPFCPQQLVEVASAMAGRGYYNQAAFDVVCSAALAQLRAAGLKLAPDPAFGDRNISTRVEGREEGRSPDDGSAQAKEREEDRSPDEGERAGIAAAAPPPGFTAAQAAALAACCALARHFDARLLQATADALARCRRDVPLGPLSQVQRGAGRGEGGHPLIGPRAAHRHRLRQGRSANRHCQARADAGRATVLQRRQQAAPGPPHLAAGSSSAVPILALSQGTTTWPNPLPGRPPTRSPRST